jgi:hypothetical protein
VTLLLQGLPLPPFLLQWHQLMPLLGTPNSSSWPLSLETQQSQEYGWQPCHLVPAATCHGQRWQWHLQPQQCRCHHVYSLLLPQLRLLGMCYCCWGQQGWLQDAGIGELPVGWEPSTEQHLPKLH